MNKKKLENDTVLVAGASGFVGRKLVKALSKSHNIVSLYHERLPDPMSNVFPVCNDLSSVDLLAAPLRGVSTAIYLAWDNNVLKDKNSFNSFNDSLFEESINLRYFKNFISACENSNIEKVIFVSCLGAHRFVKHKFLQEKYLAEHTLINSKIKHTCIVRSPLLYSLDGTDRLFNQLKSLVRTPVLIPKPRLKKPFRVCHVDELVGVLSSITKANNFESSFVYEIEGEVIQNFSEVLRILKNNDPSNAKVMLTGDVGNFVFNLLEKITSRSNDKDITLSEFINVPMNIDEYLKWEPGVYGFQNDVCFRNMKESIQDYSA